MKRGRVSGAALAIRDLADADVQRPTEPPAELSDAQAAVWRDAAASMPKEWLTRGARPLLVAYCRHVCRARLLEAQIARFEVEWTRLDGGLERLDKLLAMAEREDRAMLATARGLRITPSSRMHPRTAGRLLDNAPPPGTRRPWE